MPDVEPAARQSFFDWIYLALGLQYTILLPLAGLISFVLALVLVLRGKGPMAAAALVLIVPLPLLVGLYATVEGVIVTYTIIAMSPTAPKPDEMLYGVSMSMVGVWTGLLLMVPSYLVAVVGALVRALRTDGRGDGSGAKSD